MSFAWDIAVDLIGTQGETHDTARQLLALARAVPGHIEQGRVYQVVRSAAGSASRRGDDQTAAAGASGRRWWGAFGERASA